MYVMSTVLQMQATRFRPVVFNYRGCAEDLEINVRGAPRLRRDALLSVCLSV